MNRSRGLKIKIGIIALIVGVLFLLLTLFLYRQFGRTQDKPPFEPGDYYVDVDGVNIHATIKGDGEQTIVLLSGLGTPYPDQDFAPLASRLSDEFRVVTIEYPGYGYSDDTDKTRSNQNIIEEVRKTLKGLNVKPPYILMPHSISGIYSLYYAITYPKEVQAIIGIDNSVPNQKKEETSTKSTNKVLRFETKQLLSTNRPISTRCSSKASLVNEYDMIYENSKQLFDTPFPKKIPVHMFLSAESIKNMDTWKKLHEEMISNPDIHTFEILDGGHYLYWTQYQIIAENTKKFIKEIVCS